MNVVEEVSGILESIGAPYALIGGQAVILRGYVRTTFDADFLTTDARVLRPETWNQLAARGATVDPRKGDFDDPLAGVVHINFPDGVEADVLLAKWKWEARVIDRAERIDIGGIAIPVPRTSDLILLKLAAGGPLDLQDAARLLDSRDRERIVEDVTAYIAALPRDAQDAWQRLLASQ
jgi:hypothetical protein